MGRFKIYNPEKERAKVQLEALKRRTFLKRTAIGTGLGLMGLLGAWHFLPKSPSQARLSFVERELDESSLPWQQVENLYVPVGLEKDIPIGSFDHKAISASLERDLHRILREVKLNQNAEYNAYISSALWGVPDVNPFRNDAVNYCINAEQFMHEKVKNLKLPLMQWVPLAPGQDYSDNFDGKGFIVRNHFSVYTVTLQDKNNPDLKAKIKNSVHYQGAKTMKYQDGTGGQTKVGFVIVPTNNAGLRAPFSELLPLAIGKRDDEYANRYGWPATIQAVEAFSEAMSYILTRDLLEKKYKLRNAKNILDETDREVLDKPQYKDVVKATNWTYKNGLQACYDLFMEDMPKFNEAIRR
ncbi:MAG: hypothetical protein Q7R87_02840 [Nanoarchaeota archaeon]|nr:hypothetical protein [Nanoarchaeota archaeon]